MDSQRLAQSSQDKRSTYAAQRRHTHVRVDAVDQRAQDGHSCLSCTETIKGGWFFLDPAALFRNAFPRLGEPYFFLPTMQNSLLSAAPPDVRKGLAFPLLEPKNLKLRLTFSRYKILCFRLCRLMCGKA